MVAAGGNGEKGHWVVQVGGRCVLEEAIVGWH
jgi:hypothetical protein